MKNETKEHRGIKNKCTQYYKIVEVWTDQLHYPVKEED